MVIHISSVVLMHQCFFQSHEIDMPPKKVFGDARDGISKFARSRSRFHSGLQAEAHWNLAQQFPNADVDALERSIMGPIQDHGVGFALLRGVSLGGLLVASHGSGTPSTKPRRD